jgi:hypothetical protein
MANTTFNPSDKTSSVTLSGGNLIANSISTSQGVRAIDWQITGKFYFEYTYDSGASPLFGLSSRSTNVDFSGGSQCYVRNSGLIFVNEISTGISLGSIATTNIVCIAVDLSARLVWFRKQAAGLWNNNASANPATGVGGIAITLGLGIPAAPHVGLPVAQVTANFGDTAFSGAVPSGFTAGFTAGASIPTNALATQVALEMWASVATAAAPTGRAKVWNGSAWVIKPVKVWSGSAWVLKPAKVWNGSAWV